MELRRYIHLIRRRLVLVIVCAIVGAAAGYLSTSRVSQYRTATELYVGSQQLETNPSQLSQETGLNQILATFSEMIMSPVIAQNAITATGVPRSVGTVLAETKATVLFDTNLISVTVTDPDPIVAQKLANGVSNAFVNQIKNYQPSAPASVGTVPVEPAYVFQDAAFPTAPLSNGLVRKVILGAVFGFVAAILLVLLLDYLDITVKSADELERRLDLPVLAIIPLRRGITGFPDGS